MSFNDDLTSRIQEHNNLCVISFANELLDDSQVTVNIFSTPLFILTIGQNHDTTTDGKPKLLIRRAIALHKWPLKHTFKRARLASRSRGSPRILSIHLSIRRAKTDRRRLAVMFLKTESVHNTSSFIKTPIAERIENRDEPQIAALAVDGLERYTSELCSDPQVCLKRIEPHQR